MSLINYNQLIKYLTPLGKPLDIDSNHLLFSEDVILLPEVIIPHVTSDENRFFTGDILKHTYLMNYGGDIVEESEVVCLKKTIEPIYLPYGQSVNIEVIGNIFEDITLIKHIPSAERTICLHWMSSIGSQLAKKSY